MEKTKQQSQHKHSCNVDNCICTALKLEANRVNKLDALYLVTMLDRDLQAKAKKETTNN